MSTQRAARALARAGRANTGQPQQPQLNEGAGGADDHQPRPMVGMTNRDKYMNPTHFSDMLIRIGVSRACINQLEIDDFKTMKSIVTQYKEDLEILKHTLKR